MKTHRWNIEKVDNLKNPYYFQKTKYNIKFKTNFVISNYGNIYIFNFLDQHFDQHSFSTDSYPIIKSNKYNNPYIVELYTRRIPNSSWTANFIGGIPEHDDTFLVLPEKDYNMLPNVFKSKIPSYISQETLNQL
jgi:hypothetical protein